MSAALRGSRKPLVGRTLSSGFEVDMIYDGGIFYYQFLDSKHRPGTRSRVCLCDNIEEAEWLARRVESGSAIVARHVSVFGVHLAGSRAKDLAEALRIAEGKYPVYCQWRNGGYAERINYIVSADWLRRLFAAPQQWKRGQELVIRNARA